ncbi:nitroreductase family protein [Candidatus Bathyarchaeota archaeon]|nr:nitroreductase family protein [Candidatus Bathyarchaeota archaeon]
MDIFEDIEKRRSIRKFKHEPVANSGLKRILEAGRLAPSGSNRQPWLFIVVKDLARKKALASAAKNQGFIADADTVVVALGVSEMERLPRSSTRIPHMQDTMIAVEHMVLAATALGYGTCWIGAFNEEEVKKILNVPESLTVVALVPVGVPDLNPPPKPRKTFKEIFFKETYGVPLEL